MTPDTATPTDNGELLLTGAQWCNRTKPGEKKPAKVLAQRRRVHSLIAP